MVHQISIWIHAVTATFSLIVGSVMIFRWPQARWMFQVYFFMLAAMLVALIVAVAVGWQEISATQRFVFSGLCVLGFYMLWRGTRAKKELAHQQSSWRGRYVDHVGFTLISFIEGFIIVALLDAGASGWLVASAAVLGLVLCRRILKKAQENASAITRVASK